MWKFIIKSARIMKSYALFRQYIWLVNTIYRSRKITLEEINRKWMDSSLSNGQPMVRSTFNRHKDAIEDIFGIYIECDKKDGFKYFIGNAEVLEEESIQNWMLNTMSVSGTLSDSKAVHDRILLESIPSSGEHLQHFIDAMKSNLRISVTYRKYGAEEATDMLVEPYCIKLFKRRWYALVRQKGHESFFLLSFDRIQAIEIYDEKFVLDKDFDAATWFKDSYGIVRNDESPLTVIRIRAFNREVFYMRDLPLHHSQREVGTTPDYSDFELKIRPSADFFTPLLSRGAQIRILEPQWLAEEIKQMHLDAAALYDAE